MDKNKTSPNSERGFSEFNNKRNPKKAPIFWIVKTGGKIPYEIVPALLSDWLESYGFRTLPIYGMLHTVRVKNNIVHVMAPMEVLRFVMAFIRKQDNEKLRSCAIIQIENLLITKKGILGDLLMLDIPRYRDTRDLVMLFYRNKIVAIGKDKTWLMSYKKFRKLKAYIFFDQIIQRDFSLLSSKGCHFKKFLKLVTNDGIHFLSICTAQGYLISSYKNPSLAKATIFTDMLSQIRNDAYGRSGKGIIIKALSYVIRVVEYNGKVTDLSNDRFVFQNVLIYTALIVLQDVTKGFVFESLFSTLTDNMTIEKKYSQKVNIPFAESPKVALTTNYTIPQDTDSFKDRKHMVMLNNFFNASNKPEKHFRKMLFEWDEREWLRFDNFMVWCVQQFLEKGLIEYENDEMERQKLVHQTSQDFVDLMESDYAMLNQYYSIKKIATVLDTGTDEPSAKSRVVGKWVDMYAAYKSYEVERRTSGGAVKICFRPLH